jgi:adenylate kinase family enzyme
MTDLQPAIILLGPTGSGKTPFGQRLELRGLGDHRCIHFDFGERLRSLVARNEPDEIVSAEDLRFLRGVLESGALLEDEQFPIAQRVLASYLRARQAGSDTFVVMNGLPRHTGQARALSEMLDVCAVVELDCSADVVMQRIASNTGGDRTDRTDDHVAAIENKLAIYHARTAPLVQYYRQQNVQVIAVSVSSSMKPEEMYQWLVAEFDRR